MYMDGLALEGPLEDEDPALVLLQRIAKRDRQAMDGLYKLYQGRIHRFAMARLNDSAAADDLLSEVMLKVWKDAARFRGGSRVLTWILGIAFHQSMDQMRVQYRHTTEEIDEQQEDQAVPEMSLVMERIDDVYRVQQALGCLSETHRTVLHLAFFEDMPYAEIAEVMKCAEATVKTRIFYAKQQLKRRLVLQAHPRNSA